jgi:hypothetical protein
MKLIITEQQFKRLKNSNDTCTTMIMFSFFDKKWGKWGKRMVCTDQVFYDAIKEYGNTDLKDKNISLLSDDIIDTIKTYFSDTYYVFKERVDINYIHGGEVPEIAAKFKINYNLTESEYNRLNKEIKKINVFTEEDDDGELIVRIDYIEVPRTKRFSGIGKSEVNNIIDWANSIGAKYIVIEAERNAIPFWKKMGFDIHDQGSEVSTGILELTPKHF